MRIFLHLGIGVLLLAAAGVTRAGQPLIGAYYYPWYYAARWTNEPVCHTPRLGEYTSDDSAVADRHVAWAKEAGLDFFLVSWLTADGFEARNVRETLLPALERGRFRFAILYETPLALRTPAGKPIDLDAAGPDGVKAGDRMVAHFDQLADVCFQHPQYLRHGGRPVVVVYLVRDLVNAGPYLTAVRARMQARGLDLHLIADAIYWAPAAELDWPLLAGHFQGLTAYNMYYRPDFLPAVRAQFRAVEEAGRPHGLRVVPNVMPGYDDTPLRGTGRVTIHRRRGDFYLESWAVAREFVDDAQPFLFVTSFNEWHEGTEIEPSEEHGDRFLRLTRELRASPTGP